MDLYSTLSHTRPLMCYSFPYVSADLCETSPPARHQLTLQDHRYRLVNNAICFLLKAASVGSVTETPVLKSGALTVKQLETFLKQFRVDPKSQYFLRKLARTSLLRDVAITARILHRLQEDTLQPLGKLTIQWPNTYTLHNVNQYATDTM